MRPARDAGRSAECPKSRLRLQRHSQAMRRFVRLRAQTRQPTWRAGLRNFPFGFTLSKGVGVMAATKVQGGLSARIGQDDEQLKFGNGYDHNWVMNKPMGQLGLMARVYEPTTGRVLEVWSTEPGLQFYTGNFLDGKLTGKGGWVYQFRNGF